MVRSWFVAGLLTLGCAGASEDQLRVRAAYDLDCAKSSLRITELDERTRGVRGCGQQVTYVESCDGTKDSLMTECTWVQNTDSRRAKKSKRREQEE